MRAVTILPGASLNFLRAMELEFRFLSKVLRYCGVGGAASLTENRQPFLHQGKQDAGATNGRSGSRNMFFYLLDCDDDPMAHANFDFANREISWPMVVDPVTWRTSAEIAIQIRPATNSRPSS
jgi:hypothetical protein